MKDQFKRFDRCARRSQDSKMKLSSQTKVRKGRYPAKGSVGDIHVDAKFEFLGLIQVAVLGYQIINQLHVFNAVYHKMNRCAVICHLTRDSYLI